MCSYADIIFLSMCQSAEITSITSAGYYICQHQPASWTHTQAFSCEEARPLASRQVEQYLQSRCTAIWRSYLSTCWPAERKPGGWIYYHLKIIFEHVLSSWKKTWWMDQQLPKDYIGACAKKLKENLVDGFTTAWMACRHIWQSAELSWNISAVTKLASCLSHVNQCVLPMKLQNVTATFHTFGGVPL